MSYHGVRAGVPRRGLEEVEGGDRGHAEGLRRHPEEVAHRLVALQAQRVDQRHHWKQGMKISSTPPWSKVHDAMAFDVQVTSGYAP